jgi:hypothetical protein
MLIPKMNPADLRSNRVLLFILPLSASGRLQPVSGAAN